MGANSLINESSPYLLQHAENPVEWYAWNEAALKRAADENKPIFLSIGYSSCHWCHVMAHESFESEETAEIMNENFVNIKVDREERPDIDDVYQKVCQAVTGQGGWPLSVFLTPDQKPFYIGTYFPALESYGRPGFGSILRRLAQAWRENNPGVAQSAQKLLDDLRRTIQSPPETDGVDRTALDEAAVGLYQTGDALNGGFGSAPKFPNSACVSFLMRYSSMSGMTRFARFALMTLDRMARGGIFDQIGGGFHRYSTDARWLVPHFEKMLYDNATIPVNYAEAYQITGDPFYLDVMQKTLDFVLREMTSPDGAFYSAMDADSDGEEGRFYTWTKSEIRGVLGDAPDTDIFCMYYDVTDGGNWEGRTILCRNTTKGTVARRAGATESEVSRVLERAAGRLLDARGERVRPGMDDKILTSWNGLMITALVSGHRLDAGRGYLEAARRCADFILEKMYGDGTLLHSYKNGEAKIPGYLEDHAFFADALLDLFEVTVEGRYLERARAISEFILEHFWKSGEGFYMTSNRHEELIMRPKSPHDLSVPSGNSVAAGLLLRLHHFTHEERYADVVGSVMRIFALQAAENPFAFGHLLNVLHKYLNGPTSITVLGDSDREMIQSIRGRYLPGAFTVVVPRREQFDRLASHPFFEGKEFPASGSRAYVCNNHTCHPPADTKKDVDRLLA